MQQSLNLLVQRHEILRTTFVLQGNEAIQRIAAEASCRLEVMDLRGREDAEQEAGRIFQDEVATPFDLSQGPLLRTRLLRLKDEETVLMVNMHHIITDGWSIGIQVQEFMAVYRDLLRGGDGNCLPELPIQYADFSAWQRGWLQGEVLEKQLRYWKSMLAAPLPVLELPCDWPRPAIQTFAGATHAWRLPSDLRDRLNRLGVDHQATLYMVLLAAFHLMLQAYSGQPDIVIGTPIANRNRKELENLLGFFVNTLAIRIDAAECATFGDLLRQVRERMLGAYEHQDLPFEKLVDELGVTRDPSRSPVFQVMFVLQNTPLPEGADAGLAVEAYQTEMKTAHFDLTLSMNEDPSGLSASLEYNTDLFAPGTIQQLAAAFDRILQQVSRHPKLALSGIAVLTPEEEDRVLRQWNATQADYPQYRCVHQVFEAQAQKTPGAVAVACGDTRYTYRKLNAAANRLAHRLRQAGVGPGRMVGLLMGRSAGMIVGMLGILKAGAAYVPLDPEYPAGRLAVMAAGAGVEAVVTLAAYTALAPAGLTAIGLDDPALDAQPDHDPEVAAGIDSPAYVMFTSGSTGEPKGVVVPHRGILRLLLNTNYIAIRPSDVFAHHSNPSFDASTLEVWGPLLHGGRMEVFPDNIALMGNAFAEALRVRGITVLWLTAALFRQWVHELPGAFGGLRYLLTGGDVVDADAARKLLQSPARPQHLINGYGPTESTTFACCYAIKAVAEGQASLPIGRPIANTRCYIVDRWRQPVPPGVAGELCIAGDGLALGYVNRPDLTGEKFVANPFEPGGRMYLSGDLAKWLPDGTIAFLGRIDSQVKIRGFRIETSEVEAALRQQPGVRAAVVIARDERPGEKQLVGYVELETPGSATGQTLRESLKALLPDYMLPSGVVVLDRIPMTANGKVDRQALPGLERPAADYVAPETDTEQRVAEVWQETLGLERVGRTDNFFEIGGHSLLGIQTMVRLGKAFGLELPHRMILDAPVLCDMAAAIQARLHAPETAGEGKANPLLALNSRTQGRPLFCIHPMDGSATCYKNLALQLEDSCPVYGLESPIRLGLARTFADAEAMAADYLARIREVQPQGPYRLLGWSFGSLVAHEMARQLAAQGERVEWVCLLDAVAPSSFGPERGGVTIGHLAMANTFEKMMPEDQRRLHLMLDAGEDALRRYTVEILRQGDEFKEVKPEDIETFLRLYITHVNIMLRYAPAPLDYDLCLIRAENESKEIYNYQAWPGECLHVERLAQAFREGKLSREAFLEQRAAYQPAPALEDEQLGWGGLTRGRVIVENSEGNHAQLINPPHVEKTGEILKAYIEKTKGLAQSR